MGGLSRRTGVMTQRLGSASPIYASLALGLCGRALPFRTRDLSLMQTARLGKRAGSASFPPQHKLLQAPASACTSAAHCMLCRSGGSMGRACECCISMVLDARCRFESSTMAAWAEPESVA
eukprot:1160354-Pelagomonas_calceolata.AAC.2